MKQGSKLVKSPHQGKENFVLESQLTSLFQTKLPPAQKGGGDGSFISFLVSHGTWWSLHLRQNSSPPTTTIYLTKMNIWTFCHNENIFVRRLSFMTNRNSIGFLSCLTSVKHDKFLIDKIIRFIHLKTFLKQFDSPSIVFQQIGTFICFLFRDNLLRQYQ